MQGSNVVHEINNIYNDIWKYYMDEKNSDDFSPW